MGNGLQIWVHFILTSTFTLLLIFFEIVIHQDYSLCASSQIDWNLQLNLICQAQGPVHVQGTGKNLDPKLKWLHLIKQSTHQNYTTHQKTNISYYFCSFIIFSIKFEWVNSITFLYATHLKVFMMQRDAKCGGELCWVQTHDNKYNIIKVELCTGAAVEF